MEGWSPHPHAKPLVPKRAWTLLHPGRQHVRQNPGRRRQVLVFLLQVCLDDFMRPGRISCICYDMKDYVLSLYGAIAILHSDTIH